MTADEDAEQHALWDDKLGSVSSGVNRSDEGHDLFAEDDHLVVSGPELDEEEQP